MSLRGERARANAERILVYYFRQAWLNAGLSFGEDNESEVRGIVTDLLTVAEEEAKDEIRREQEG